MTAFITFIHCQVYCGKYAHSLEEFLMLHVKLVHYLRQLFVFTEVDFLYLDKTLNTGVC